MTSNTKPAGNEELDQESEQALLLEEAYNLGYHRIKNGCLVEPLKKLNDLITASNQQLLRELEQYKVTAYVGDESGTRTKEDVVQIKIIQDKLNLNKES